MEEQSEFPRSPRKGNGLLPDPVSLHIDGKSDTGFTVLSLDAACLFNRFVFRPPNWPRRLYAPRANKLTSLGLQTRDRLLAVRVHRCFRHRRGLHRPERCSLNLPRFLSRINIRRVVAGCRFVSRGFRGPAIAQ